MCEYIYVVVKTMAEGQRVLINSELLLSLIPDNNIISFAYYQFSIGEWVNIFQSDLLINVK